MKCTVVYQAWREVEIPDEIIVSKDEEMIAQEIYNQTPTCLSVKEIQDKNKKHIVENW